MIQCGLVLDKLGEEPKVPDYDLFEVFVVIDSDRVVDKGIPLTLGNNFSLGNVGLSKPSTLLNLIHPRLHDGLPDNILKLVLVPVSLHDFDGELNPVDALRKLLLHMHRVHEVKYHALGL